LPVSDPRAARIIKGQGRPGDDIKNGTITIYVGKQQSVIQPFLGQEPKTFQVKSGVF